MKRINLSEDFTQGISLVVENNNIKLVTYDFEELLVVYLTKNDSRRLRNILAEMETELD